MALLFIEGGVVLAHQIVAPKILAPLFGNSVLVWTAVLVCTLAGLACGYMLGDHLAREEKIHTWLATTVIISALLLSLAPLLTSLAAGIFDSLPLKLGVIAGAGCVVTPLMVLLGTCAPLGVEFLCKNGYQPARATGMAFGVSTLGGVTAALVVGLWSMPLFGIRIICWIGATLLILAAIIFWSCAGKPLSDQR